MAKFNTILLMFVLLISNSAIWAQCQMTSPELDNMQEKYIEIINSANESLLLKVKIADEGVEQTAGFQHICAQRVEGTAILFVFNQARNPNFHMRNVYANLDVAFIDQQGRVVNTQMMKQEIQSKAGQLYSPNQKVKYVLEVHQGYLEQNLISAGSSWLKLNE